MDEIEGRFTSIDEVHSLGGKYLLLWCYMYEREEQKNDPLVQYVRGLDAERTPSCLVFLRVDQNRWIGEQCEFPRSLPVLIPRLGGFGITAILPGDQFQDEIQMVEEWAAQFKSDWEEARRQRP